MKHIGIKGTKEKETRFVQLILKWGEKNRRSFPWRKDRTPYKVLLAEILLQRTPANRVAEFFPKLVKKFPSPQRILETDVESFRQFFHPMGLEKRVKWLLSLTKEICDKYNCKVPNQEDELVKLPGVGPYTARAILCFGFDKDVSIVDVNVARVLSRVFHGFDTRKRPNEQKALMLLADKIVPKGSGPKYNEALLDHAALICKWKPKCNICPVAEVCEYSRRS